MRLATRVAVMTATLVTNAVPSGSATVATTTKTEAATKTASAIESRHARSRQGIGARQRGTHNPHDRDPKDEPRR